MALRMTAVDGTVFGVYNQGNGDYIACEDERGFHHAPPQYQTLPQWSEAQARRELRAAVRDHEAALLEDDR